jgi:quercetin dioxygenase-like cupin family protein
METGDHGFGDDPAERLHRTADRRIRDGRRESPVAIATIPPGNRTRAHVHAHHETAFYMVSGGELEL